MLAVLACDRGGPPPQVTRLEFDRDPASATFAQLRLTEAVGGDPLTEVGRARLAAWADKTQADLLDAVGVWTGAVSLGEGCRHPEGRPRVLGRVVVGDRGLLFEPRFPWVAGLEYTACADTLQLAEVLGGEGATEGTKTLVFAVPQPAAEPPGVTAVWPDAETVPANLLRLYVRFDQPMHRRQVAAHVRLLDAAGESIAEPFVEIPDGLWDGEGRRLTLFLHPGRVKRGVGPREALGGALVPGQRVILEISAGLESARGRALAEPFRRAYAVGAADRSRPDPARWTLRPPATPNQPLRLEFDEVLDREQFSTAIRVYRDGEPLPGAGTAAPDGRAWSFAPSIPWQPGSYYLEIDRGLEDLAGNTIDRLFDVATVIDSDGERALSPSMPRGRSHRLDFTLDLDDR